VRSELEFASQVCGINTYQKIPKISAGKQLKFACGFELAFGKLFWNSDWIFQLTNVRTK